MTVTQCLSRPAAARKAESTTERSDRLIKERAKGNIREGVGLLAHTYGASLRRHAENILGSACEAEEIVQDVLIRALREGRLLDPDFRILGWVFRVTTNLCLNRKRDLTRRNALLEREAYLAEPQPTPDPEEVFLIYQARQRFEGCVARLSPTHAEIIRLRFEKDLSYEELAVAQRTKLGTVMSRLSRAKDALRKFLHNDPDPL